MFLVDTLRLSIGKASPVALHFALIFGVAAYTIFGALIVQYLENRGASQVRRSQKLSAVPQEHKNITRLKLHRCLNEAVENILSVTRCDSDGNNNDLDHIAISPIDDCYRMATGLEPREPTPPKTVTTTASIAKHKEGEADKWNFENAVIFSFTVITTIGYGHVVPETTLGRIFVIIFGLIGVPAMLLTIADLGMFLSKVLQKLTRLLQRLIRNVVKRCSVKNRACKDSSAMVDKESREEDGQRKLVDAIVLCLTFVTYLFVGARILASYEPEMNFFEAVYFNFVTLTTIGLGDFVPKSYDYLFLTLLYIGVGLALTTMAVEIAADTLKKLHYFGRKMENVANVVVWFGGRKMTMGRLIKNLGDQFNIPTEELQAFDITNFVDLAVKVEQGEIPSLRPFVNVRETRAFSYSHVRKSQDAASIFWADESARQRVDATIGLPPLATETARTITTVREPPPPTTVSGLRIRVAKKDDDEDDDDTKRTSRVRFSGLSFVGSESSMNYSEESVMTLR